MPTITFTSIGFPYTFPFTFGAGMQAVQVEDAMPVRAPEYRHLLGSGVVGLDPALFVEGDQPFVPNWNRPPEPVWPTEYRYLLPSVFMQLEETDLIEPAGDDLPTSPYWNRPPDPVQPVEYRYLLPSLFLEVDTSVLIDPDDPTIPVWHTNYYPVRPLEYRVSEQFAQIDPANFQEFDEHLYPHWHTNYYPVQPVEYRYLLPSLYIWQAVTLTEHGVLVQLPERTFTAEMKPRTLNVTVSDDRVRRGP